VGVRVFKPAAQNFAIAFRWTCWGRDRLLIVARASSSPSTKALNFHAPSFGPDKSILSDSMADVLFVTRFAGPDH
jgi:hypothetical protein